MRRRDFHVSVYILIPLIFSGISLLGVIVTYRITAHYLTIAADPAPKLVLVGTVSTLVILICSFLILRFILKPITKFVRNAEKLPVLSRVPEAMSNSNSTENIEHLHKVLDQVTTILGKVEARELFPGIIGQSRAMRAIFGQIMKVAPTDTTILLTGESGTGKELIATAIYEQSLRKNKPFIKINCVAIPEGLLESELFGHEKGSFTGAIAQKKGKFEVADGGTIFLDEIGDMPLTTQAKILRVLQEREFERVGGANPIRVDVRIIAATNRNLSEMIKTRAFREDLFYRLNVFSVHLPPLRERREDIPFLTEHILEKSGKALQVSQSAMRLFLYYNWPGNIRELWNVVERAAVIADETIEPVHLPKILAGGLPPSIANSAKDGSSLDERLAEIEKGIIIEAMTRTGGIQSRAAQILGINQRSLWHRMKKYNIVVTTLKKQQNL